MTIPSENISGDISPRDGVYDFKIPQLAANANIKEALKLYHYGTEVDSDPISTDSVAGQLATIIPLSTVTAKGDIIVGTASGEVSKLAASATAGSYLTADSSTTTGLKWEQVDNYQDKLSYVMGLF